MKRLLAFVLLLSVAALGCDNFYRSARWVPRKAEIRGARVWLTQAVDRICWMHVKFPDTDAVDVEVSDLACSHQLPIQLPPERQ